MRRGLGFVQVSLGVLSVVAFNAGVAHAYVYWTVVGVDGSGGTTLGRADLDASGVTHSFISGASDPAALVVDGSYVYWSNYGTNSIGRANLNGSDPNPNWISGLSSPADGLAIDGSSIYWTETISGTGYVGRASITGGIPNNTCIKIGANTYPEGIGVAADIIYIGTLQHIVYVDTGCGETPLPDGPTLGSGDFVQSLTAVGGDLYYGFGTLGSQAIGRMTTSGGGQTTVVPSLTLVGGIASDGTYLYWTDAGGAPGDNVISRGLIDSTGLTNVDSDFISEPNWPLGVAVDAGIDPTATAVSCVPASVATGQASSCTATVADSASSSEPTGTVDFTAGGSAFFLGDNACGLLPKAGGGASCSVGIEFTAAGTQTITAGYNGDPVHQASTAVTSLCAGTATQCGGSVPPPKPKPKCAVPKLKGKTLVRARTLLKADHCSLGKVTTPRAKHGHKPGKLVVGSTKPKAGTKLANGSKVELKLVAAPKKHKHA